MKLLNENLMIDRACSQIYCHDQIVRSARQSLLTGLDTVTFKVIFHIL